eukprot:3179394-Rhodomonas_salina.1
MMLCTEISRAPKIEDSSEFRRRNTRNSPTSGDCTRLTPRENESVLTMAEEVPAVEVDYLVEPLLLLLSVAVLVAYHLLWFNRMKTSSNET